MEIKPGKVGTFKRICVDGHIIARFTNNSNHYHSSGLIGISDQEI